MMVTQKKSKSKWMKKVSRNRKLPLNANTSTLQFYFRPEKQGTYLRLEQLKSINFDYLLKSSHLGKSQIQLLDMI